MLGRFDFVCESNTLRFVLAAIIYLGTQKHVVFINACFKIGRNYCNGAMRITFGCCTSKACVDAA